MNDRTLYERLHNADVMPALPIPRPSEIRRAVRRRAQRRAAGLAMVALVGLTLLALHTNSLSPDAPMIVQKPLPNRTVTNGAVPNVDLHDRIMLEAAVLIAKRHEQNSAFAVYDPSLAREAAAETLLLSAQRELSIAGPSAAMPLYEHTRTLFPETSSAAAATVALDRLRTSSPNARKDTL